MVDRKGFNGLRVPNLAQPQMTPERAIAMEMHAICREIFVRAASDCVRVAPDVEQATATHFAELARNCQIAARAYFIGLGVIQDEPPAAE